jgi:TrpR-related protein YerC/YecD
MQKNQITDKGISKRRLDRLYEAVLALRTKDEAAAFLRDLCTMTELQAMAERLAVAERIARDESYRDIADDMNTSTTTVTRVAHWLHHGRGGYPLIISRMHKRAT